MKYHRIKCNLYKAEGNSWEQMAEEITFIRRSGRERVVRLVLFTRCTDNQEYKFQRSFLEQWVERHFVSPPSGRFACGSKNRWWRTWCWRYIHWWKLQMRRSQ